MLVLGRAKGTKVTIIATNGEKIVIDVLRILPSQVKLGFNAPKSVKILRDNAVPHCCDGSGCPACSVHPADL